MSTVTTEGEDERRPESLTRAVLLAVADRDGTDPSELEPPLHHVVDPEALNSVFAATSRGRPRSGGQIGFVYRGYEITAHSDGRVRVRDPSESPARPPMESAASPDGEYRRR